MDVLGMEELEEPLKKTRVRVLNANWEGASPQFLTSVGMRDLMELLTCSRRVGLKDAAHCYGRTENGAEGLSKPLRTSHLSAPQQWLSFGFRFAINARRLYVGSKLL